MNEGRRARVLRAIVEDYVATNEPVGSKALVERHGLQVSPATIRNDMAALEQQGLIAQPHTSAGRVPTDKGYREFVDRIDDVKPLSAAEKRAIARIIERPVDIDEMLDRTVRLLASLTHQVAVVQYPMATTTAVRHLEFVDLAAHRLLVVLITDSGQVEQRIVDAGSPLDEAGIAALRDAFNDALHQVRLSRVGSALERISVAPELREWASAISEVVVDLARSSRQDRLVMAGTANLARSGRDFGEHIGPLLEAFEEQVVLLKLLTSMVAETGRVSVRIGRENPVESFASTSVVATGYGTDDSEAKLAVLGPTRMDYPTTMAAVRAVARYVSVILSE
ncbi:heat-inducible transcriptional repressor HrcA [Brevibacterium daeguense]|uniref:Heat-inducible transcription repressor HrcA n=1 Tax=Brevibacterium daeguense TaxID=909936 RepID=A0ABP8EN00_9MICO|nr:heat-inducible transcriptional repressor HrcA [Brevibacterium daeguense]